ncbi:MAG: quinone oxidoreductase [Bacteroidota bacterium]
MTEAIVVRNYGGPEVLKLEQLPVPVPQPKELLLQQTAIGINFHDIYCRSGLYKTLSLPGTPGIEGVGTIIGLGSAVKGFQKGDRVAYITSKYNGYSSQRTLPAAIAVPVPNNISDEIAASTILKGLTVQMLCNQVTQIKVGDRILIHAAAGGVGQLLVQAAKQLGAMVIGTVGSVEKSKVALKAGCDHIIFYREERVLDRVLEITNGEGLNKVYDSVGKDTFHDSLASLTFEGHLINFGQSSGPIEGFEIPMLAKKSATLSRPMIFHYTRHREKLLEMSEAHFKAITSGQLIAPEPIKLPLREAAKAHELLASRTLTRPIVLIP